MNEYSALILFFVLPKIIFGFNTSIDIKYEQFDTEILLYLKIENNSPQEQKYKAEIEIQSLDFSSRKINNSVLEEFELDSFSILNMNIFTIEYSVLAQSKIFVNLLVKDEIVALDSLTLDFPNSFTNVNSEGGPRDVEFDLGGLKIDRTRTPIGRNFFESFEKNWVSPNGMSDYTIEIEELPFRFRTTRLKIYLDGEVVVETFLRDNEDFLEQLLNFSIATIRNQLYERTERDDEIGGDWNGI